MVTAPPDIAYLDSVRLEIRRISRAVRGIDDALAATGVDIRAMESRMHRYLWHEENAAEAIPFVVNSMFHRMEELETEIDRMERRRRRGMAEILRLKRVASFIVARTTRS